LSVIRIHAAHGDGAQSRNPVLQPMIATKITTVCFQPFR
jgi:hypothetical protein